MPRLAAGVPGFSVVGEDGRRLGSLKAAAALKLRPATAAAIGDWRTTLA